MSRIANNLPGFTKFLGAALTALTLGGLITAMPAGASIVGRFGTSGAARSDSGQLTRSPSTDRITSSLARASRSGVP